MVAFKDSTVGAFVKPNLPPPPDCAVLAKFKLYLPALTFSGASPPLPAYPTGTKVIFGVPGPNRGEPSALPILGVDPSGGLLLSSIKAALLARMVVRPRCTKSRSRTVRTSPSDQLA